jgi:hypothetical protein
MTWQSLLPATRGTLPNDQPVWRTDPGGSFDAPVAILGVYPAGAVARTKVGDRVMNLPVRVEQTSFELGVSASAKELDARFLDPLGLDRASVLTLDVMPYFLANTRKSKGRSMADNLREAEAAFGGSFGIEARPAPEALVKLARQLPGNVARLTDFFGRSKARLLLTLGSEAAAFVRHETYEKVNGARRSPFESPTTIATSTAFSPRSRQQGSAVDSKREDSSPTSGRTACGSEATSPRVPSLGSTRPSWRVCSPRCGVSCRWPRRSRSP